MAGIKKATVTDVFNGQSLIAYMGSPAGGYTSTTTFADVTSGGWDFGQVVEGSTSWDGDDPSIDVIKDEQGDPIVTRVTAGTYAFSFECATVASNTNPLSVTPLGLSGIPTHVSGVPVTSDSIGLPASGPIGFKAGKFTPLTGAVIIFNDESDKWILFPKAKIVGSFTLSDGLWRMKVAVTAEFIDTPELGTVMLGKGAPIFSN